MYGVTIYAGHDSKVMMNSTECKAKLSKIEKSMNVYIIFFKYIETQWWTINQEPIEIWRIEYLVVREQKLRLD